MGAEKEAESTAASKEPKPKAKGQIAETCERWALSVSTKGGTWWMPFVLLGIVIVNTLSAGTFIWLVGVLQASLFAIIVMSRKYTFFIGPLTLCAGSFIGGYLAISAMNSIGKDALLEKAGMKDTWLLTKAENFANDYGVWGLLGVQLSPVPTPTAVICVAGTLAGLGRWKILATLTVSKFIQLMVSAVILRMFTSGMSPEEYIRKLMDGENPLKDSIMASLQPEATKAAEEKKED
mmetsp:Transcript_44448/g.105325  ORF Transcript_44448/g.105325 Transcript_44448/m.105325 type:complete len:236 (-) Transcript_44448:73-780(-)